MPTRLAVALTAIGLTLLAPTGAAQAAINVANTNDSGPGSLRQAIADAPAGETINVPVGTYTLTSGPLKIERSMTIAGAGNTIISGGGASRVLETFGAQDTTLRDLTITGGSAVPPTAQGAAIDAIGANLTLERVAVTGNAASANGGPGESGGIIQGGIVRVVAETFNLLESSVDGNLVSANGGSGNKGGIVQGGVMLISATVTMRGSSVSANRVEARGGDGAPAAGQAGGIVQGGGILASAGPVVLPIAFSSSTLAGNQIDASGGPGAPAGTIQGGVLLGTVAKGSLTIAGTTIAGNVARGSGTTDALVQGAAALLSTGPEATLSILGSTLSANRIESANPASAAANLIASGAVRFGNSIVAGGVGPAGVENCLAPESVSLGFNIDDRDQCGFHAAGDWVNTDPQLGPLAFNGGPTLTMAPQLGSPAIDRGAAFGLGADQRGVVRPIDLPTIPNATAAGADGSDIGAVEVQPSNQLGLGKLKRNKRKGTAILIVNLPAPTTGILSLAGKGLKPRRAVIAGETRVKLTVAFRNKKLRKLLRRKGRRKVGIRVTYSPTGNAAATKSRKAKLVQKKKKKKKKKRGKRTRGGSRSQ